MENSQFQGKNESSSASRNRRNLTTDVSNVFLGTVPPHSKDLEQAVLGAIMLDRDALATVLDILKPESFYDPAHQSVYQAMLDLFRSSRPIDILTVTEELRKMSSLEKIGGAFYLVELTNRIASSANIEYHARIISQKHIQRELIRVSTDIIRLSFEDSTDVFDLMDKAEQNLFSITETNLSRSFEGMGTLAPKLLKHIELLSNKADGLTGVPSGFTKLDRLTAGFQPSDLIIVAARPAMGKTAFTLSLAKNAAGFGRGVAFFSLEMSSLQLVQRLIASESGIQSDKLRTGKLQPHEWQALQAGIERMSKTPIFIDDTPGINIFELRAKCRRLKAQHDIQLIIIDYLQLMTGGGAEGKNGNREQEISSISRGLKGLAKELNVPVIALSQLSRAVESRGGSKRPQLSDLRESGAIEQDADIVSFIYRPEYYDIMEDENGNSTKGIAEIIVAKHRNGALDDVKLRFIGELARFEDHDDFDFNNFADGLSPANPITANTVTIQSRMNDDDVPF